MPVPSFPIAVAICRASPQAFQAMPSTVLCPPQPRAACVQAFKTNAVLVILLVLFVLLNTSEFTASLRALRESAAQFATAAGGGAASRPPPPIPTPAAIAVPTPAPELRLSGARVRVARGNASCVVVGCHTPGTPGAAYFWDFLSRTNRSALLVEFAAVTRGGAAVAPHWCSVPTARLAQRRWPRARVLYLDVDTWVDVRRWCDVRALGPAAPIVMNSLWRVRPEVRPDYVVAGSRVQSNAFLVAPGKHGAAALRRYEAAFYVGALHDQGAISIREGDVCGVPGWIACFSNPRQNACHCHGKHKNPLEKEGCIKRLFVDGNGGRCVPEK